MKKVQTIFLCIGLLIFAVSFVVIAIDETASAMKSIAIAREDDIYGAIGEWFWICLNVVFIPIPFLLSELSLIRNGYILLKDSQPKAKKVLCIISSILALLVIIMVLLVKERYFEYIVNNTILLTLWPCVIVSFILGFICIGNVKNNRDL